MELSLGGLLGAMVGCRARRGELRHHRADGRPEAARRGDTGEREDFESRITAARRSVLAFNMLVFVGAGYWAGTAFG